MIQAMKPDWCANCFWGFRLESLGHETLLSAKKPQAKTHQKNEAEEQRMSVYGPDVSSLLSRELGIVGQCFPYDTDDDY